MGNVISIFGSSRPREGEPEYLEAFAIGRALAQAGYIICNGGYGGIMEASSRGAKEAGGATIGVTVDLFARKANQWTDCEIQKATLVERLATLVESAEGFVVLKGGTGTLLELAYVWEFINKKFMREKPVIVYGEFWTGVVETLRSELLWEGLGDCTSIVRKAATPEQCVEILKQTLR